MAAIWEEYITQFGAPPKNTSQLRDFSKSNPNHKPLTLAEANNIFESHNASASTYGASSSNKISYKPIIQQPIKPTKPTKPVPVASNNGELKRQRDECLSEIKNLESIEMEFNEKYNKKINDIEKQLESIYDALKKRENDLKNWRKKEYDEGINEIHQNKEKLQQRLNELNELKQRDEETLYKVPKLNDFYLHQFNCQSLQIQNALNIIFQIGATYQQNNNNTNRKFISFEMNKNAANHRDHIEAQAKLGIDFSDSPFGKGKIYKNTKKREAKTYTNNVQENGTKALQYAHNKESAIRGFDIGNNAKYAAAQQMAKNTNALPSNFWESESETDSEEERKETQRDVVSRWKTQKSNITLPKAKKKDASASATRTQHVYDNDTSSEEEDDGDENEDGFETYVAPKPILNNKPPLNTQWIVEQQGKTHKYDTMWFKLPKMRNGKANGRQMKPYLEKSGLSKQTLKEIWRLSDLDKDGKMGNEEFVLCMFLVDEVQNGVKLPHKLPQNYIPPSFRGKRLAKTPPKRKPLPTSTKPQPPSLKLNGTKPQMKRLAEKKVVSDKKPLPQNNVVSHKKPLPENKVVSDKKPLPQNKVVSHRKPLPEKKVVPDRKSLPDRKPPQLSHEIRPKKKAKPQYIAPTITANGDKSVIE